MKKKIDPIKNVTLATSFLQSSLERISKGLAAAMPHAKEGIPLSVDDDVIVALRDAAQYIAMQLLPRGGNRDECQDAEDIASQCVAKVLASSDKLTGIRGLLDPVLIDEAIKCAGKPGRPGLGALVYTIIECAIKDMIDALRTKKRSLADPMRGDAEDSDPVGQLRSRERSLIRQLSSKERATKAQIYYDQALDLLKWKRLTFREAFTAAGAWTPMAEWLGLMDLSQRPGEDVIPKRSLQRMILDIQCYISAEFEKEAKACLEALDKSRLEKAKASGRRMDPEM